MQPQLGIQARRCMCLSKYVNTPWKMNNAFYASAKFSVLWTVLHSSLSESTGLIINNGPGLEQLPRLIWKRRAPFPFVAADALVFSWPFRSFCFCFCFFDFGT